jgi:TonB family protein
LIRFVRLGRDQAVPALLNAREVAAATARVTQTIGGARGQTVVIGGVVTVDGTLAGPTVARSGGSTEVDREALRIARLMRFSPARIDGVALQAPTSIPVTFQ